MRLRIVYVCKGGRFCRCSKDFIDLSGGRKNRSKWVEIGDLMN